MLLKLKRWAPNRLLFVRASTRRLSLPIVDSWDWAPYALEQVPETLHFVIKCFYSKPNEKKLINSVVSSNC